MPCLQFKSHLGYPCGPPVAICKQCLVRGSHLLEVIWLAISFCLMNQQPLYFGVWYCEEKPRQRTASSRRKWYLSNWYRGFSSLALVIFSQYCMVISVNDIHNSLKQLSNGKAETYNVIQVNSSLYITCISAYTIACI